MGPVPQGPGTAIGSRRFVMRAAWPWPPFPSFFTPWPCPCRGCRDDVRSGREVAMRMGTHYRQPIGPDVRSGRNAMDFLGIGIVVLTLVLWVALTLL